MKNLTSTILFSVFVVACILLVSVALDFYGVLDLPFSANVISALHKAVFTIAAGFTVYFIVDLAIKQAERR